MANLPPEVAPILARAQNRIRRIGSQDQLVRLQVAQEARRKIADAQAKRLLSIEQEGIKLQEEVTKTIQRVREREAQAKARREAAQGKEGNRTGGQQAVEQAVAGTETDTFRPQSPASTGRFDSGGATAADVLAKVRGGAAVQQASPAGGGGAVAGPSFEAPSQITERSVGFGAPGRVQLGNTSFGVPNFQVQSTSRDNVLTAGEAARLSQQSQEERNQLFLHALPLTRDPRRAFEVAEALQSNNIDRLAAATDGTAKQLQEVAELDMDIKRAQLDQYKASAFRDRAAGIASQITASKAQLEAVFGPGGVNTAVLLGAPTGSNFGTESSNQTDLDELQFRTQQMIEGIRGIGGGPNTGSTKKILGPSLAVGWLANDHALLETPAGMFVGSASVATIPLEQFFDTLDRIQTDEDARDQMEAYGIVVAPAVDADGDPIDSEGNKVDRETKLSAAGLKQTREVRFDASATDSHINAVTVPYLMEIYRDSQQLGAALGRGKRASFSEWKAAMIQAHIRRAQAEAQ